jgi:hypothetical protein
MPSPRIFPASLPRTGPPMNAPFTIGPLYPFSCAVPGMHAAGRAKWSVETECDRRATAQLGVASRDRADSSGATNRPLWLDHLGGTRAPSDWP